MKVLELFAGTRSIGKAFEARGHEVFSVEWDKKFENINLYADIGQLTAQEVLEKFGHPDVIWMSPDCTSFSISAISHHRKLNPLTGNLDPISDYAKFCDQVDQHCLELIKELNPTYWFIENPVGGMRKMVWMKDLPRYTVTYCFSGDTKFVTDNGHRSFAEMENKRCQVLNINGDYENAIVRNYGKAQLYKLTLSRARKKYDLYVTANHKWFAALPTGTKHDYKLLSTLELTKGMLLPYAIPNIDSKSFELIPEYVCRGFVFGDGWILKNHQQRGSFIQFCGEKQEMIHWFTPFYKKLWEESTSTCSIYKANGLPSFWKTDLPTFKNTPSEIFSWLAGYFAADGSCSICNGQVSLSSANLSQLLYVRELAEHIGIGTYQHTTTMRTGYGTKPTPLYQCTFVRNNIPHSFLLRKKHLDAFIAHQDTKFQPLRYSVVSVEPTDRVEDVFCCETEHTHTFTLDNGIVTHNCRYGDKRMKPTDLWTNHPNPQFLPPCHNGDPCHESAPRGSRTGTQGLKNAMERSRIPDKLCEHIVDICEGKLDPNFPKEQKQISLFDI